MPADLSKVLSLAESQIGYREGAGNVTKYNKDLGTINGTYGYAWCQSFQSWLQKHAGGVASKDYPRTAGCLAAVAWFKKNGRFSKTPKVGDQVFYGENGGTHVELVTKVTKDYVTTIGGNTGGSLGGTYFNGDGVYKKNVSRNSSRIYGYGSPVYAPVVKSPVVTLPKPIEKIIRIVKPKPKPKGPAIPSGRPLIKEHDSGPRVKDLQEAINFYYRPIPRLAEDGKFGPATKATLKRVQKWGRVDMDGVYGLDSEKVLNRLKKARS